METYKINPISKTLILSAAFEKAMNNVESDEYKLYIQLQQDIPGLKVSRRTHKSPLKYHNKSGEMSYCNQYKNLTYANMEGFIKALPKRDELMDVYEYLRYHAGLVQTSCYAAVRQWFEMQFPNFRKNSLSYYKCDLDVITDVRPIIKRIQEEEQDNKPAA